MNTKPNTTQLLTNFHTYSDIKQQ